MIIFFYNKYESQHTVSTNTVRGPCVPCLSRVCFVSVSCPSAVCDGCRLFLSSRSGIYTHTDPGQWSNKGQISKITPAVYANNASTTVVYDKLSWTDNFAECCMYVNLYYAPNINLNVFTHTPCYYTYMYIVTNIPLFLCECVVFSLFVNFFYCSISAYAECLEK